MKKLVIVAAIIIAILSLNKQEEKIIIPEESIRFRVIANSDTAEDQKLKKEIVHNLSTTIKETNNLTNIDDTRTFIKSNLPELNNIVEKTLLEKNQNRTFHINYGKNYFPEKEYQDVVYKEGEYESLVVTLGDGKGQNFWCVLFPPLCMIDEDDNTEYKSLIKEVLDKYF